MVDLDYSIYQANDPPLAPTDQRDLDGTDAVRRRLSADTRRRQLLPIWAGPHVAGSWSCCPIHLRGLCGVERPAQRVAIQLSAPCSARARAARYQRHQEVADAVKGRGQQQRDRRVAREQQRTRQIAVGRMHGASSQLHNPLNEGTRAAIDAVHVSSTWIVPWRADDAGRDPADRQRTARNLRRRTSTSASRTKTPAASTRLHLSGTISIPDPRVAQRY